MEELILPRAADGLPTRLDEQRYYVGRPEGPVKGVEVRRRLTRWVVTLVATASFVAVPTAAFADDTELCNTFLGGILSAIPLIVLACDD
jgi:hypothetical protein